MKSKERNGLYIIIGLGQTGLSCVKYGCKKGWKMIVCDNSVPSKKSLQLLRKIAPQIDLKIGSLDIELLKRAKRIIISPGVDLQQPVIKEILKSEIPCFGDIELFTKNCNRPIIGITGTNGKSTTTTMVYEILKNGGIKANIGGNIGIPVVDLLHNSQKSEVYVLEISSSQLELTNSLQAEVATILNFSPDHQDRYKNLDDYLHAKLKIYKNCKKAVINCQDSRTWPDNIRRDELEECLAQKVLYATIFANRIMHTYAIRREKSKYFLMVDNNKLIDCEKLYLSSYHQYKNCLAALAITDHFSIPWEKSLATLSNFQGLDHRCQFIGNFYNIFCYNDSKATNSAATLSALESLGIICKSKKIILILGGRAKENNFTSLGKLISIYCKLVIIFGESKELIYRDLKREQATKLIEACDLYQAVKIAFAYGEERDILLFSPACTSFDSYRDYQERGNHFIALIEKVSREKKN